MGVVVLSARQWQACAACPLKVRAPLLLVDLLVTRSHSPNLGLVRGVVFYFVQMQVPVQGLQMGMLQTDATKSPLLCLCERS